MRRIEKRLPGFTIFYMHDSTRCRKCILLAATHNETCKPGDEFYEDDYDSENYFSTFQSLSPVKKSAIPLRYSFPMLYTPTNYARKIHNNRTFHSDVDKKVKPLSNYQTSNPKKQSKTLSKVQKKKSPPKRSDFTHEEKSSDSSTKVPGKGTLKRKRLFLEELEHLNDDCEDDDLFEDRDFGRFRDLLEDESDYTDRYDQLKTPVFPFSLTPRETTPSPSSKSFYSPSKLSISRRKEAQQCHYRRIKRKKKKMGVPEKEETPKSAPKTGVESVLKCLEQVADILKVYKTRKEKANESDDDPYYSDV